MSADECRTRLRDRGVGRVAVPTEAGPAVFPVNYVVAEDDTIVYRTAPDAAPAAAVGRKISFEVDQVDDALSQGWSVLVSGAAEEITEAEAADLLPPGVVPRPWPGGERNLLVRVTPSGVTGRLIRAG
nr:pyridoxamine 5'-phosphate oxidase family protein [Streptomyces sp. SID5468]